MTRIRIAGLCLVALFAISAFGASSALAFPERGTCKAAKKGAGEYLDSLCQTPGLKGGAKKEFVWVAQAKATAFTSTTGEATLKSFTPEGAELPAVTCTKSKGKGKALTSTTSESVVTFEGCTSAGEKCTGGAKAKAGQIITFTLDGKLGTIGGGSGVGEVIKGAGPGGLSSEFKCGANEIKTEGAVIGEVSPVNARSCNDVETVVRRNRQHAGIRNAERHGTLQPPDRNRRPGRSNVPVQVHGGHLGHGQRHGVRGQVVVP